MQIERISDFAINSQRKVITKVFAELLALKNLSLTILHFLKFAIILHLSLHHPNIKILTLCAEPIRHPLL